MNLPDLYSVLAGAVGTTVVLRDGPTVPVKLASVHRVGPSLILAGCTLDGRPVHRTVTARGDSPLVPAWAVRLGSMLRLAWSVTDSPDWDATLKDLIAKAGLPVDPEVRWAPILHNIFVRDKGLGKGDSEYRDELIQDALVKLVLRRSLEKFNPDAVKTQDPNYLNLGLAQKVTVYVKQLLRWAAGEALDGEINKPPTESIDALADAGDSDEVDPVVPVEPAILQNDTDDLRSLSQIREAFFAWLQQRRSGPDPTRLLLVFDLLTHEPSTEQAVASWKQTTNTGYQSFRKTVLALREALVAFANHGSMRHNQKLVQTINDLRLRSLNGSEPAAPPSAPLQADPGLIPAEPQAGVGPKAQAMKSSALEPPRSHPKTARPDGPTPSAPRAPQENPSMPTPKFATLKRLAAEAPEEVSTKVEAIKQHLLDQVTLLENFQEQLDMSPKGAAKFEEAEGDEVPEAAKPEPEKKDDDADDQPSFEGLKKAAEEEPEEIEAAIQDFFLGLDQIMAETEGLAETLGVELVAPELGDGDEGLVEFSGSADPETAERMFDAGAATEEEEAEDEFTVPD